jgi:hypothetical protein
MTERFTRQGCKVTTTFDLHHPNGSYTEHVTLECVTPLDLVTEESPGLSLPQRGRVRATKFGFELVPERGR